jgi:phospholipase C
MDGFVTDYISFFTVEMGRQPTYDEYRQIMTGYTPEQVPVISEIARGFGVFDHWFSEVPSQTMTNRSFWTAATSSGFVVNRPMSNFMRHNRRDDLRPAGGARQDVEGLCARARPDLLHRDHPHGAPKERFRHQLRAVLRVRAGRGRRAPFPTSRSSSRTCWRATATTTPPSGGPCFPGSRSPIDPPFIDPRRRGVPGAHLRRHEDRHRSPVGSNVFNTTALHRLGRARRHLRPRAAGAGPATRPIGTKGAARLPVRSVRVPGPGHHRLALGGGQGAVFNDEYRHTSMIATLRRCGTLASRSPIVMRRPDLSPCARPRGAPRPRHVAYHLQAVSPNMGGPPACPARTFTP